MKTTKKLMSVILTLGLFLSQIQPVIAAQEYSLSNFTKTLSYADNSTFTDIGDSASSKPWYNGTIKNAYEYALIAGVGDAKFSPSGNLTTAQAITIAGRIHSIYKYGTLDNFNSYSGANWYDGPVQYAKAEGLISNEFDNVLTENITRADMVYIWYGILQSKDLTSQNIIESLPDVGSSNEKEVRIHRLYAAGILSGVDALGTFNPNTNITRAEAAAIFSRIVDVNQRKKDVRYPPEAGVEPTPQPSGVDPRVGTGNWRGNSFEMAARPNATGNPGGDAVPVDLSDYHIPTLSSNFNRWGIMKDSVVTELIASAFRT
ncbi:MAG: S-layer homology domain-containing protein, partial [Prevotella sp.]|nr:S-layer homology domain-containing protein [Prevotella sp.]